MSRGNLKDTFGNEFDLTMRGLEEVVIKETYSNDNCYIWDRKNDAKSYDSFILKKNSRSKTICNLKFYPSSEDGKYIPRPTFIRKSLNGKIRDTKSADKVLIKLDDSETASRFWELIGFLSTYKELVDIGDFVESYKVIDREKYILAFENKQKASQLADLVKLIESADLSSSDLRSITFEQRKKTLRAFFYLLKNVRKNDQLSHVFYRKKYGLRNGEEYIWHHFLKKHDWILGLNVDPRFITEFINEVKTGIEDSEGKKSPISDMMGVTDFTTLIELKHTNTNIFKKNKSKGRSNTWDFTSDFIEGISQCLGQKFELEKSYDVKDFIKQDESRLDKTGIQTIDPKSIFLIGNKKREFPINKHDNENLLKNLTLQRFRRNNRNIDILTYDELFERAYQIVYSEKLDDDWYWSSEEEIFEK